MKATIFSFLAMGTVMAGLILAQGPPPPEAAPRVLRHMVVLKFKPAATPAEIDGVIKAFAALPQQIKLIEDYEAGTNISPEKLDQGFTHCFLVTFSSEANRDTYLKHPAHQAFGAKLKPVMDAAFVVDFWSRK